MATNDDLNRFRAWAAMIVVIGTTIAVLGDTFLLEVSLSSRNLDALVYLSLAFFGLDVAAERRDQILDALEKAGQEYLNGGENGENDDRG